ncbi:TonB-dependent receptor plug domain-containing protein, partial [Myxococcota bacterium]|nr:TonB-dependent receptor plug domain-containing protein [Myxococcota bacterium]
MINLLSLLLLMEPSVVVIGERPSTRNEDLSPFVTEIEGDAEAVGDLGALLEGAIGARVRREGGVGGRQTLQLRGGGAHQVGIFLDDIPLQPARGGAFDLARLPAAWVERGRLIRGPSAARWGGGAQGGVLQLESRESPDHLALKLGSFGLTQLDGGARWGQAALIGHLSHAQGDFPFKDTNGALRRREGNAHLSGGGLMRGQLGGARLLLSLSGYQRGEPGPEQFPRSARAEGASVQLGLSARPKQSLRGYAYAQGQINRYVDPQPPAVDPQGRFQLQEGGLGGGLRFEAGAG